mmetsp:Transcript_27302/g.61030  ORF Transcript_27302/g.61030 Transcript_27302/m.61030 type:complete len:104 (-) Transcript_27302:1215-1526(-)
MPLFSSAIWILSRALFQTGRTLRSGEGGGGSGGGGFRASDDGSDGGAWGSTESASPPPLFACPGECPLTPPEPAAAGKKAADPGVIFDALRTLAALSSRLAAA